MLNINRIRAYEMGLVFHNGKLEKVLNEGKHWTLGFNRDVYVYDKFGFEFHAPIELDLLMSNTELKNALDVFEVKEDEILVIKFHGNIFKVLRTGHYAFWKGVRKASFQVFNTASLDLISDVSRSELETALLAPFVRKHVVGQYQTGLLYVDGSFKENIKAGLLNVFKNTKLKGRWQILQEKPKVICDTAHNKEGLKYTLKQLQQEKYNRLHIVLGVVSDKDLDSVLPLFPKNAAYYFCKPNIQRGLSEEVLKEKSEDFKLLGKKFSSVKKAYKKALSNANQEDIIYVGGSTFVVAEVI